MVGVVREVLVLGLGPGAPVLLQVLAELVREPVLVPPWQVAA